MHVDEVVFVHWNIDYNNPKYNKTNTSDITVYLVGMYNSESCGWEVWGSTTETFYKWDVNFFKFDIEK